MTEIAEQRILIHAPLGKDAALAENALSHAGFPCFICRTPSELLDELDKGAAAVLAVEEALPATVSGPLTECISRQPHWSDLPILVLTKPGSDSPWIKGAYERFGNLTLLERPLRVTTLISAVRAALRARLKQYEMRLADQRKDEFLAMLAHELRNPLAPIGAAAQLLELVADDADRVRKTGEIIARQVEHMTGLIDDLLDIARVTRKLIKLVKDRVDMRQVLSEAVEQVNPLIRKRQHELVLHLSPDPACVLGDYKRLVQVVVNLLNNAAKYTPENGHISVHLRVPGDEVVLEVSDNGIGMEPALVVRVFELFAQGERSSDRSLGGLGLGLPLVRNLVELHGGSVWAKSDGLARGSTFTVRMPRLADEVRATPDRLDAKSQASGTVTPLRVLVVDDNVDAANMLDMLLNASGHEVCTEYSASGAIEQAQRMPPQVCLLDIGLPDMDGYELARRLRVMPEMESAVLIAVTGYGQEQDRKKSSEAGFAHHLVNPVNAARLLTLLAQIRFP
ncbi:hybrid sensor histidine kinase/response regulator [Noviherbaspirillum denitrificans]|uniref:histidine kinase n=1 Tax=Noviherbaspirillum denitrificans TaxID=1968433 RepID=A0A254TCM5_9BURK|nr:ATP-binding protein [Noviherbaspirillum denitrificans]OWW19927.1 hybrid sensor histidine kinase/response regulator [Noviherbaspirillum denitrificans]